MVKPITGKSVPTPGKSRRLNPLAALSNPALDAPLVAASWWLLFTTAFDAPVDWRILASLFPAVWVIYLFDRIYDATNHSGGPPWRKAFAKDHPVLLRNLLILAMVWTGSVGIFLPRGIWIQTVVIGLMTLGYFLIFRWKVGSKHLPVKEILIGFCFAAGVGLPFTLPIDWTKLGALTVFGTLSGTNCLIISRAEAEYDRDSDQSAWFSKAGRSFPFRTVFSVCSVLPIFLLVRGLPVVLAGSLMTSNLLLCLLFINTRKSSVSEMTQSLADAALWLPGICGSLISAFS